MADVQVELVAPDRSLYSGPASIVLARTLEGELGIMAGHVPVIGVLDEAPVTIRTPDGKTITAAVNGGFLSVANDTVQILAERAELETSD